jgi:hypothetical protein
VYETQTLIDNLKDTIKQKLKQKNQTDNYRLKKQYQQAAIKWSKIKQAREVDADNINKKIKGLQAALKKLKEAEKITKSGKLGVNPHEQVGNILNPLVKDTSQVNPLPIELDSNQPVQNINNNSLLENKSMRKKPERNSFLKKMKQRWKKFRTKKKPIQSNPNIDNQLLKHGRPLPRDFYNSSINNQNVRDRERKRHFNKYLLENKSYNNPPKKSIFNTLKKTVLNFRKTKKGTKKKNSTVKSKQIPQKFCTNCGTKLKPNIMFCTECGTKL